MTEESTKAYRITIGRSFKKPGYQSEYFDIGEVVRLNERQANAFSDRVVLVDDGLRVEETPKLYSACRISTRWWQVKDPDGKDVLEKAVTEEEAKAEAGRLNGG